MEMLYRTANEVRIEVALAYKLLLAAVVLFVIFIGSCCVPTQYTAKRVLEGTVVQKVKGTPQNLADSTKGTLMVRHADGTVAQIEVGAASYAKTELGVNWNETVSDSSLGYPMPTQHKLLLAVIALSGLGSLGAMVWLLCLFKY